MNIEINWDIIPTYKIEVTDLSSAYDISSYMKDMRVDKYLYMIKFNGTVIKYGMSADNSVNYGERLYRQIGHSESWGSSRLTCTSGEDWRDIEEKFKNIYGIPLDKDSLSIKVWDVTKYPFQTIDTDNEIKYMESTLIDRYRLAVGETPIGNINDGRSKLQRPVVLKNTWDGLFE